MTHVDIIEKDNKLTLKLTAKTSSPLKITFLFICSIISFLMIVILFFFTLLNVSILIWSILFIIVFYLSFRALLWNLKGKELVLIDAQNVIQILDYGFFKDKTTLKNKSLTLAIELQKTKSDNTEKLLDEGIGKYHQNGIMRLNKKNNVLLELNHTIPYSDLEIVENLINKHLQS